jgi:hypothetical protein
VVINRDEIRSDLGHFLFGDGLREVGKRLGVYSIGKFAKLVGVSVDTLERWDKKGLLKAGRTLSGRRMYTADDVKEVVDTSGKQETK